MPAHAPSRPTGQRSRVVLAVLIVLTLSGCGKDSREAVSTTSTSLLAVPTFPSATVIEDLPPNDSGVLAALLDPGLDDLDLELSSGYLAGSDAYGDADGALLALYTTPKRAFTGDDYNARVWPLTAMLVPVLFDRWPALDAIDICQESLTPTGADRETVTQVRITRSAASSINWEHGSAALLSDLARSAGDGVILNIHPPATAPP